MSKTENTNTTASEVIADLNKEINTLSADVEYLYNQIRQANAIFKAICYSMNHDKSIDRKLCMEGFEKMMEVLVDNAENSYTMSKDFRAEV